MAKLFTRDELIDWARENPHLDPREDGVRITDRVDKWDHERMTIVNEQGESAKIAIECPKTGQCKGCAGILCKGGK